MLTNARQVIIVITKTNMWLAFERFFALYLLFCVENIQHTPSTIKLQCFEDFIILGKGGMHITFLGNKEAMSRPCEIMSNGLLLETYLCLQV